MQQQGIEPNDKSYTTAIHARSKGGQWQQAVDLLREALAKDIKPTTMIALATLLLVLLVSIA
jgi:pentatricopeptide repeat protein